MITTYYPESKGKLIGILEAGVGVGLLLGPLIGSGLYELGGYSCPFFTLGFIVATMLPLLMKMLSMIES